MIKLDALNRNQAIKRKVLKTLLLIALSLLMLVLLWIISRNIHVFPLADFVEYWASGRLNMNGGDPYNPEQMLALERTVGWNETDPLMMLNPPWTLLYSMFLGIFPYAFSRFLWFILQVGIVFACSILLWRLYRGEKRWEWIAWISLLTFGPILRALQSGQVTLLVLLGCVGFLYCITKKTYFWAGVLGSLVFVKPHLLYLFAIALLIWSIDKRRFSVLVGVATGLIASTGIAWLSNSHLIAQYLNMFKYYPLEAWATATLGSFLRTLLGEDKFYVQFLPVLIGVVWLIYYWYRNRHNFDWQSNLPLIVLVSIVTSPYGWTLDYSVIAISIIQVIALFNFQHWSMKQAAILVGYWLGNLVIIFVSLPQTWFWWFPSYILAWYLLAYRFLDRHDLPSYKSATEIAMQGSKDN